MSSQISPAVAPLLGGVLQQLFHWQATFIGLLIVVMLATLVILVRLRETHLQPHAKKNLLDQLHAYQQFFKQRNFLAYSFASAFIFVVTIGYYAYMPFILHRYGYSPVENGLIYIVYAVGIISGAFSLAKFLHTVDHHKLMNYCIAFYLIASMVFFAIFLKTHALIFILLLTICFSTTCGITAPLTMSLCLYGIKENKGAASATQSFIKMFFTAIALIVFNFIAMKAMTSLTICFFILALLVLLCNGIAKNSKD